MTDVTREHLDTYVHRRLRTRVRLYLGISALIIIAIAYRILFEGGGVLYPVLALVLGLIIGIVVSRMFIISWDADSEKVVSRMDAYGIAFLVAYVLFVITGEYFIRQWFNGPEVLTIILSLAGGAVLGRGVGMGHRMLDVVREHL